MDHRGLVFSDVRVRVLDGAWLHRGVGDKALQEAGVVLGDFLAACVLWHNARWEYAGVWDMAFTCMMNTKNRLGVGV